MHVGRGHANGDSMIYFPQERVVHTGDMFVRGAPFIDYANGGSAKGWNATLAKILEMDFDTIIPGHGPVSKRGVSSNGEKTTRLSATAFAKSAARANLPKGRPS